MAGPVAGGGGEQLRRFRRLADLTAVVTFLLIVVGGVVRVSESGLGCGPGGSGTKGWPLCGGQVIPLVGNENRIIEFSHRLLATVVVLLIAAPLLPRVSRSARAERLGLPRQPDRRRRWCWRRRPSAGSPSSTALPKSWSPPISAPRCCCSACCSGSARRRAPRPRPTREREHRSVRGLKPYAATAAVLLFCAIVAGGYMAGTEERGVGEVGPNVAGAHMACGKMFPECGSGRFLPFGNNRLTDIHLTHRAFVYLATIAIIVLLLVAFARGSRDRLLALAALLLFCQVLLGALNVWLGEHGPLIVAHLATATLLWATVVSIGYRLAWIPAASGTSQRAPRAEASAAAA